VEITGRTAGTLTPSFTGGTPVSAAALDADGTQFLELTAATGNDTLDLAASSDFAGAVSRVVLYRETVACAPAGTWDYVLVPQTVDNVAGDPTPAFSATIY